MKKIVPVGNGPESQSVTAGLIHLALRNYKGIVARMLTPQKQIVKHFNKKPRKIIYGAANE
jgi:hypothetical protein